MGKAKFSNFGEDILRKFTIEEGAAIGIEFFNETVINKLLVK
jgi:hypothetical protein